MKFLCAILLSFLFAACPAACSTQPEQPQNADYSHTETQPHEEREIFLTFDDGPTDSVTPLVLDVLQKESVKATFFLIGRQIEGREQIVRRIAAEGHAIGIHSYSHEYGKIYATPGTLVRDIEDCRTAIRKALPQYEPTLYRFPGGSFGLSETLKQTVKEHGLHAYDWNAATGDANLPLPDAKQQYRNAVQSAADRQKIILLQHDCVGQKNTVLCLPSIIAHFRELGYTFKTLPN